MTWELAESGTDFITSVINGADLVPTFSAASVDDLRAEVIFFSLLSTFSSFIESLMYCPILTQVKVKFHGVFNGCECCYLIG